MIDINTVKRVFLAKHKVDFRKSFDGLLAEAYSLGLDPLDGDLVLFIGRCRTKIKILFCDGNGIWVFAKRFHRGTGRRTFGFIENPSHTEIDRETLETMISGLNWSLKREIKKVA